MSWSRGMTFKHLLTMRCSGVDKRRRWKGSGTGNIQFQHNSPTVTILMHLECLSVVILPPLLEDNKEVDSENI